MYYIVYEYIAVYIHALKYLVPLFYLVAMFIVTVCMPSLRNKVYFIIIIIIIVQNACDCCYGNNNTTIMWIEFDIQFTIHQITNSALTKETQVFSSGFKC